jgi:peptidoglycan/xylan/chitin deacetylase (PgdA/CDA1 family)
MTMMPGERADFSAIVDRPPLQLPGGAKVIVWTIVNLEVWDITRPMARQVLPAPTGVPLLPDVPNWAWHEYGMRVGFWRFKKLYDALGIKPTLSINARVTVDYPGVAQACLEAGWEFMGHAYEQMPIHKVEDQKAMIERSMDTLERFCGKRPVGWLGPGLTQTYETPDLLAAAGVKYIGDFPYDDEPTEIRTAHGPLVTLPYTVENNDIPMMIVQHHEAGYWTQKCCDTFDRYYQEAQDAPGVPGRPKIMAIAIHPYISGQPFRIGYLEKVYEHINRHSGVLHWNGEQILNWYQQAKAAQA